MSKDEIMDEELAGMVSYTDETVPAEMPRMEQRSKVEGTRCEGAEKAMDASWRPTGKQEVSLRDRLIGCAKWAGICGGISMLLWYFQINDLMAMRAAYPCIVACGILGGFGVGKYAMK